MADRIPVRRRRPAECNFRGPRHIRTPIITVKQRGCGAVGGGPHQPEARRWRIQPGQVPRSATRLNMVNQLYELFRGDQRGLVEVLEGLQLTLRKRNQTELQEQLGDAAWDGMLA